MRSGRREYMTLIGANEDVQVLAVQHDQQEDQDDADVRQHEDGSSIHRQQSRRVG